MTDTTYQIHWLAFTVHAPSITAMALHETIFQDDLGSLEAKGHGGRGFKELYTAALAYKLYTNPVAQPGEYYHIEIPGQACEVITWDTIQNLFEYLELNHADKYAFRRLDLAFDHPGFEPEDFTEAIKEDKVRSLTKRETIVIHQSPFRKRDSGDEIGTYTVEFGSMYSERMLTIYNRRGFTRMELKLRGKRAEFVAAHLFSNPDVNEWYKVMIAHLLDFVDVDTDWWREFISRIPRAGMTVSTARELTSERILTWMYRQVAPALSAINDAYTEEAIKTLVTQ